MPDNHPSYEKVEDRVKLAKELNLDCTTISVSEKTHLVLFHGMTDEEMEMGPEAVPDADSTCFGIHDIAMWKRFMDRVRDRSERKWVSLDISPLTDMASKILDPEKRRSVTHNDVKEVIKKVHITFIRLAYPLSAAVSVLIKSPGAVLDNRNMRDSNPISGEYIFKGSQGEGRVTQHVLQSTLKELTGSNNLIVSDHTASTLRSIDSLIKFYIRSSYSNKEATDKIEAFRRPHLPRDIPTVIREYLARRSREERAQHWASVLGYAVSTYGYYSEVQEPYLTADDLSFFDAVGRLSGKLEKSQSHLPESSSSEKHSDDDSDDEGDEEPKKKRQKMDDDDDEEEEAKTTAANLDTDTDTESG